MATYAQPADVRTYAAGTIYAGQLPAADPDLAAKIERAERYVDHALGRGVRDAEAVGATSGLLFQTPATDLTPRDVAALNRATCAQVLYMLEMGDEFFVRGQRQKISGPSFSTEGREARVGPQVWEELTYSGLLRLTTHTGSRRWWGEADDRDEERRAGWWPV